MTRCRVITGIELTIARPFFCEGEFMWIVLMVRGKEFTWRVFEVEAQALEFSLRCRAGACVVVSVDDPPVVDFCRQVKDGWS